MYKEQTSPGNAVLTTSRANLRLHDAYSMMAELDSPPGACSSKVPTIHCNHLAGFSEEQDAIGRRDIKLESLGSEQRTYREKESKVFSWKIGVHEVLTGVEYTDSLPQGVDNQVC